MKTFKPKVYIPTFESMGHLYQDDAGNVLKSVTTILKAELGLYQYRGVSTAAGRGTNVHLACQYFDEGDLDEKTITPEVGGYLESYKKALKSYRIKVEANELMRYHPDLKFAGMIDKIVGINGRRGILDIKTGRAENWHKWQTAAYEGLLRAELGPLDRYDLYIKPDSFLLIQHTSEMDWAEFTVLLAAHNIRMKNGYLPKGE